MKKAVKAKDLKEYTGMKGVALCEMKDGTRRILSLAIARRSMDKGGAVKKIVMTSNKHEILMLLRSKKFDYT